MQRPELIFSEAYLLLDQGQIKDAYGRFLNAVEVSTRQLYNVKFNHDSILSKDPDFQIPISVIRSSLHHLEDIAERKVVQSLSRSSLDHNPPPWEKVFHTDKGDQGNICHLQVSATPPPLPPKPIFPPKPPFTAPPSLAVHTDEPLQLLSSTLADCLHTGFDYDLIKSLGPVVDGVSSTNRPNADHQDSEDDSDDEDELIRFNQHPMAHDTAHPKCTGHIDTRPRSMSEDTLRINTSPTKRPKSLSMTYSSPTPPVPCASAAEDVLAESVIDASVLMPAQTNTGESLAPPPSPGTTSTGNGLSHYVPHIPAPPLLTTHRRLQGRLDELEAITADDAACKPRIHTHDMKVSHDSSLMSSQKKPAAFDNNIDPTLQLSVIIAETRETLNRVRTLYMSAATIPDIMQFPPTLVAYQLTLIESAIFRRIPPNALLTHSPRSPHQRIVASTDFFNYITRAIEHSILLPQEASRRAELINRWIKIATQCLSLNNYQTLKAIVSALGTPPIQRLRRTWDCIPKKRMAKLDLLTSLMSETDNYGAYRYHMHFDVKKRWHTPVIPFLGVFIHDTTYLLAAAIDKDDPANDPRMQTVLDKVRIFQLAPPYPQHYPVTQKTPCSSSSGRKYAFRTPAVLTNAINRNASLVKHKVPALFGSDSDHSSKEVSQLSGSGASIAKLAEDEVGVQQQLITQYLLMRPWVNEKLIDELSVLREPPRPTRNRSVSPRAPSTHSSRSSYTSSIFSNANSLVRRGSGHSTNTSTRSSWEDEDIKQQIKATGGGVGNSSLWPFRKIPEMSRTMALSIAESGNTETWSDEDNASESRPLKQQHQHSKHPPQASSMRRTSSATGKILSRNKI